MLNWADYTILALLALSILMGLWRGFIGEVIALVCWLCAFWVAWMLGPTLAQRFTTTISTPSARMLLAYALCFVAVLIVGAIVSYLMRKLVEGSGLSGSDRLLGMVFGLARGVALVVLIVMLLELTPFTRDPWWHESRLLPEFEGGAHWATEHLPADMARYLEPIEQLVKPPPPPSVPEPPATAKPSST
ncbi:MAG: CvpA family protein [Rhodanobacter sp.]|jgi:membrane protein required for colicin V production|nr:CvpA family protein [Rhodanobacter sp.]